MNVAGDQYQMEMIAMRWEEAWNNHDMKALRNLVTEDADFVNVGAKHWKGRKEIEEQHTARLRQFIQSTWATKTVTMQFLKSDIALVHVDWELMGDANPDGTLRKPNPPSRIRLPEDSVMKPVMNLDEVEFDDVEENGLYTSSRGQISDHIGAKKLGYNLTVLPAGKVQCPFHCHHGEEEMFFILEGEGELRFGDKRYPIRKHDVIACPPGGPDVAHQIINTGTTAMRYLALSMLVDVEACEYPDSQKILIVTGKRGERGLRKIFRAESTVDYYDREAN